MHGGTDIGTDEQQPRTHDERDAPAPADEGFVGKHCGEEADDAGGQQQAEDDAADGEPDEHPGECAAREEHTAQGHALGEPGLFHGFAEDGRAEGGPDEHGGPRSEHDFGRGHVGQQVEEGQRGGDSHGGQEIEGPDDDRCGGHPEIEGHLRRNVTGSQQVEQAGEAEHGEPL